MFNTKIKYLPPRPGERFASALSSMNMSNKVYKLYGKKALDSQDSPPIGKAVIESHVGYHIREGGHSIESFDWKRFLDFADYHLK